MICSCLFIPSNINILIFFRLSKSIITEVKMSLINDDAKDPLERDVEYDNAMNDLPEVEMDEDKVIRYTQALPNCLFL